MKDASGCQATEGAVQCIQETCSKRVQERMFAHTAAGCTPHRHPGECSTVQPFSFGWFSGSAISGVGVLVDILTWELLLKHIDMV